MNKLDQIIYQLGEVQCSLDTIRRTQEEHGQRLSNVEKIKDYAVMVAASISAGITFVFNLFKGGAA